MASVDHVRRPATRRLLRGLVMSLLGAQFALGCAGGFEPLSVADAPEDVHATAVRVDAVRLAWTPVPQVDVVSYIIQRRVDLAGAFVDHAQVPQTPLSEATWLDTDVEPETFYGYRIISVTSVGDRSQPSTVGGALTPPLPGIEITTSSLVTAAEALDPDGYEVVIAGPDTVRASLGVQTKRRFSPLRPGTYTVTLNGLISRCSVGTASRQVNVTDTTAQTIAPITFQVTCRDPNRGELAVSLQVTGAELDELVHIDVLGEAGDEALPPAERTYSHSANLDRTQGSLSLANLHPGTYDVTISEIADNCTLTGTATRTVTVTRLGTAAVAYVVNCVGTAPPDDDRPFVLRNRWTPAAAPNGAIVHLVPELDLTSNPAQSVRGVQADFFYDAAVLRYDSTVAARLPSVVVNGLVPGKVSVIASSVSTPRTGLVRLFELAFTVIGANGQTAHTVTQDFRASTLGTGGTVPFGELVRVEEDTFTVGAGAGVNAPPVAQAGGPYGGTVGTAIALNSAGSSDSDGTIVSYAWAFGDGTTGSGASTSKSYAAAGTYTVTLTVTDDDGATATDQATVTVTAGSGGGNTPPVAQANGPYTATAGSAVTLSSAGSSDAGGSIASYSWTLGNGQTASGAAPSVTYATAGTYTITLTVTDNGGLTATDQATITVSGAQTGGQLTWRSSFGPYDAGNNWVTLELTIDLSQNISDTPGIEAVRTFVIDSLKWDPTKFQLVSVNLGAGISGAVNQSLSATGKVSVAGSVADAFQAGNGSRILTFATLRLRPTGTSGTVGTTTTTLGPVQGPASTNFFVYNSRITVIEGSFTLP
jgi:PKD repeat protein